MQVNSIIATQNDSLLNVSNIFTDPSNSHFAKVLNTFLSVNQIDVSNSFQLNPTINIEAIPQQLSSITALNLNQIYDNVSYTQGNITINDFTNLKDLYAFIKENINQISDITLNGKRISTDELDKLMNSEILDNLYLNVVFPNIIINIATNEELTKIDYFVNNENKDELVEIFDNLLQKMNHIPTLEESNLFIDGEKNSTLVDENLLQNNATLKQNNNLNLANNTLEESNLFIDGEKNSTLVDENLLQNNATLKQNNNLNLANNSNDVNDLNITNSTSQVNSEHLSNTQNSNTTDLTNQLQNNANKLNDKDIVTLGQKINQNENSNNNTLSTNISNIDKLNTKVLSNNIDGDKSQVGGDIKLTDLQNSETSKLQNDNLNNAELPKEVSLIDRQFEKSSNLKEIVPNKMDASVDISNNTQQKDEKINIENNHIANKINSDITTDKKILHTTSKEINNKENNAETVDVNEIDKKQLTEISNKESNVKDHYIEFNTSGQIKVSIKKVINNDLVNNNSKNEATSKSQKADITELTNTDVFANDDIDVLHNELNQRLNHKTDVYYIDKENDNKQNLIKNNKNENFLLTQEKSTKNNPSNGSNSQNNDLLFNRPTNDKKAEFFENSLKNDINLDFNNYFNDIKETKSNFINNNSTNLVYKNVKVYEIIKEVNNFVISRQAKQLVLQIEPERLGKMKVGIEVYNNVVKANVEVENETVKRMLENNNNLLRESLAQQGLQLAGFSISLSSNNDKSSNNTSFASKKHQKKFSLKDGISKDDLTEETKEMTRKKMGYNSYEYIV